MPILEIKNLKKYYKIKKKIFERHKFLKAVDGISISIEKGETVGLVGESGCGKSTLAKVIVGLEKPTEGTVFIDGKDILNASKKEKTNVKKTVQMIFQDPYSSLNPQKSIFSAIDEVLYLHTSLDKNQRYNRSVELLELVGMKESHLTRYPDQFSGGQRQRIGIARALAVNPKIIVADEPVSALDVSIQAQIINLMIDIQRNNSISFLFIAHDLAVVENISDKIYVMYLGKIVEYGKTESIISKPSHPYTIALLNSVPGNLFKNKNSNQNLMKDFNNESSEQMGCKFYPRCKYATEICKKEEPLLEEYSESNHFTACFNKGKL